MKKDEELEDVGESFFTKDLALMQVPAPLEVEEEGALPVKEVGAMAEQAT